jgi:adenosylhomocysteine nucleosidase
MKNSGIIGIIGAMDSEISKLKTKLLNYESNRVGNIIFHIGEISGQTVVVAKCGVGKVNAARCTQLFIDHYKPEILINTGIAGGIGPELSVGDVVIATGFVQHDFDVTAFGHVKGYLCTGEDKDRPTVFGSSEVLVDMVMRAATSAVSPEQVKKGIIATGDMFVSNPEKKNEIYEEFDALAVEMEGAAFAQTAYYNQVPFVAIRAISDLADGRAAESFETFEKETAELSAKLIEQSLYLIKECEERENGKL